ncbi:MAG: hypothetical protein QXT86_09865 [Archaeoglobaceae archaeon]
MQCPNCGTDTKFLKKKKSPYAFCPNCRKSIPTKEIPVEEIEVVDKYPWEEVKEELEEETMKELEEETTEGIEEKKKEERRRYEPLFDYPKDPTRIIEEVLMDWGIDEEFIKHVVRHVERKGFLETSWLFNMLVKGRTGRKIIPDEALMIIEEITSAIENERRKAESLGMTYVPFQVIDVRDRGVNVYGYNIPVNPYRPQLYVYPPTQQGQPAMPQVGQPAMPQFPTLPQQQILSPDVIKNIVVSEVSKLLEEKKKHDEINELRKKVYEDIPSMIKNETDKLKSNVMQTIKELFEGLKEKLQPKEEGITKKDLELLIERIERSELQKTIEELKKVLQEKTQQIVIQPPPSEGYQNDGARLIADALKTIVNPGQWYPGRAVENLIRVLPQIQQPQTQKEVPGEKSVVDLVKEYGGDVG